MIKTNPQFTILSTNTFLLSPLPSIIQINLYIYKCVYLRVTLIIINFYYYFFLVCFMLANPQGQQKETCTPVLWNNQHRTARSCTSGSAEGRGFFRLASRHVIYSNNTSTSFMWIQSGFPQLARHPLSPVSIGLESSHICFILWSFPFCPCVSLLPLWAEHKSKVSSKHLCAY